MLAGLEVARTLDNHGIETEAPIEVAFWTATDTEGKKVKAEVERIGYLGEQETGDHPIGAYFESHIEYGPVLEDNEKTSV